MNSDSELPSRAPAPIRGTSPADLDEAARVILSGGLVAIPTETVYGLAADATNGLAVAKIYTAKGRPSFNPLICHVSNLSMAIELAEFSPLARELAEAFWPGPLTLVLPRTRGCPVAELATAGLDTIALRSPKHVATLGLIERAGRPLAAPSANPSETISPTTAAHVAHNLGSKIDLIIDGGACSAGLESTIIALHETGAVMLRPGALERSKIESLTGPLASPDASKGILAPGMMRRHYAPRARLRLNALEVQPGEAYLAFGAPPQGLLPSLNLSIRGDLEEAASNLFAMLRALDESHTSIAVAPIPESGIGEAMNDRLNRAGGNS
ncbi:MAG TPA: L-threonylcarbamoyladenylate synthase [Hyphomonadaceae bacterium]|jgi:L-threonylcarbamoyladenylate synthase|nr:L-threonylcarbamoyladenylate synthase [Hyphomonadaceae bacterium]